MATLKQVNSGLQAQKARPSQATNVGVYFPSARETAVKDPQNSEKDKQIAELKAALTEMQGLVRKTKDETSSPSDEVVSLKAQLA